MQKSDLRVLIVDDDKMSGELIQKRLIKRGLSVDYVESGQECLEYIEEKSVDLILLDLMMPGMDGSEVLMKIREKYNNFELPVIILTAKDGTEDTVESLRRGANDYLLKPVNLDIAIARIKTQVQIVSLLNESLQSKQIKTVNMMVTTLNHEINNPLMIAIGNLSMAKKTGDKIKIEKALKALDRIADIVKKIEKISSGSMEEVNYTEHSNMFKI